MSPGDLEARKPVWRAFSELFLDTDVRMNYVYTTDLLASSPYSLEELRRILDEEVTPALEFNLRDIAGEWAGFDDEWLIRHIESSLTFPRKPSMHLDGHWRILAALVTMVRGQPGILPVIRSLMPLFLYKQPSISPACGYRSEYVFRQQLMPLLGDGCMELHRSSPGVYPSLEEIESNWEKYASGI